MKILLAQSYFRILDPKELERNMPYPPLGSLYAAAILKNLGHDVVFFDSMLSKNIAGLDEQIRKINPDIFLLYDDEFNYLTKMCLSNMRNAAVNFIRTAGKLNIPSVIYSSDAADFPEDYLQAGCAAVIYGEGEITLQELISSFNRKDFDKVKHQINGIRFLQDGKIFSTNRRKLIEDINSLPLPDYSFINIEEYRDIWLKNHKFFSMNVSTTRGCPYRCNWCAKPLYGQTYNSISPVKAASYFKLLKEKYEADHIWITDDIFGLKPNWIRNFSEELEKLQVKIPYKCLSRPDLLLRGDTITNLKDSGCRTIWIGAESGSQKILDAMEKGTTVKQIYNAADQIHKAGMEVAFFIQFGYMGEELNDISLTRKMIRDCLPDDIGISVSYPLPGTKFFDMVKSELKNKKNWSDSDDLDMMFNGTYKKNFYKLLHRFVHAEYRIFMILKKKKFLNIPRLFYLFVKFICYKIKINNYLKNNSQTKEHQPELNTGLVLDQINK